MSQAEIAGGAVTPPNELPSKGRRLRDFGLLSTLGRKIWLSEYRGRSNLVVVVADDRTETTTLLRSLASQYTKFKAEESEVLAIVSLSPQHASEMSQRLGIPFPILIDEESRIHSEFGAVDERGDAAAVYITDRFGEVFGVYRTRDRQSLPDITEIVNWLEFINSQCPECEPPEWPA